MEAKREDKPLAETPKISNVYDLFKDIQTRAAERAKTREAANKLMKQKREARMKSSGKQAGGKISGLQGLKGFSTTKTT